METKIKSSIFIVNGKNYLFPFLIIASLFLLWGVANGFNDVLCKHFQNILGIGKAHSALVQTTMCGGYFLFAIPAAFFITKFGYKAGVLFGLGLFVLGSFSVYPVAMWIQTFPSFLISLFIIACGLACLETTANTYATILGPKKSGPRRLLLAQVGNGLGWIIGPILGGKLILAKTAASGGAQGFSSIAAPYMWLGGAVLLVLLIFCRAPLPHVENDGHTTGSSYKDLIHCPLLVFAVIAQFAYMSAQVGLNSFFINYVAEVVPGAMTDAQAAFMLGLWGAFPFMCARLLGSWVMKYINPPKVLGFCAVMCVILCALVMCGFGMFSVYCLCAVFFFEAIMFPTIYAIGISGLGELTPKGGSLIIMAVLGGAIVPYLMGYICDVSSMQIGFIIPLISFVVVAAFAFTKVKN